MSSINALLTRLGKNISPGETISFTLVKGPSTISSDPISTTDKRTPALAFPRVAKFIDTVVKPDFQHRFQNGRLYEENVPTAKDDSDDETDTPDIVLKDEEGNVITKPNPNKKKKRWRKFAPPRRHWVLCEEEEYQMKQRSETKEFAKGSSHRYEGVPEFNTSNYVLLSLDNIKAHYDKNNDLEIMKNPLQLKVQTVHGFHSFSQPARIENVSLHQVEQQISIERALRKNQLLQSKRMLAAHNNPTAVTTSAVSSGTSSNSSRLQATMQPAKVRKARLFQKLMKSSNANDDDENDVMGDLSFRNKQTSSMGVKAREELLSDMADEEVLVDGDGVLGGVNDSEFGGGGRFGSFRGGGQSKAKYAANAAKKKSSTLDQDKSSSAYTFDGSAMASDFYTRDVSAEYEDLDYDPNEQFDDDDQDMGQGEISLIDQGGFVGDGSGDEDEDGDEDGTDNTSGGGLATKAGYRAFMAKARGEVGADENSPGPTAISSSPNTLIGKKVDPTNGPSVGGIVEKDVNNKVGGNNSNLSTPTNPVRDTTKRSLSSTTSQPPKKKPKSQLTKDTGVALDASGQRIINFDTVRKEIWLHNQQIPLKKLGKIFGVSNKKKDRVAAFKACLKELCTVVDDPVEGQKICRLKQHYSNMGSG